MVEPATADAQVPGVVSIVIPCYRGAAYLAGAIDSCLRQSYKNIEVIVVDDASPDDCAAIAEAAAARDPRVRLVRRPVNGGVARAFNSGFEIARGEYFTRLAQDDVFRDDAVAIMQRRLAEKRDLGLVYCDFQAVDANGKLLKRMVFPEPAEALATQKGLGLCFMWRRTVWEEIGGFDPAFDAAEDYEFCLRLAQRYPVGKDAAEAPLFVRFHDQMGTRVFGARQEVASGRARARYCPSRLRGRRLLSDGYFEAGYICRAQRRFMPALKHLAASIWYWPLATKSYRCLAALLCGVPPRARDNGQRPSWRAP